MKDNNPHQFVAHGTAPFDVTARAKEEMLAQQFSPVFEPAVLKEVDDIKKANLTETSLLSTETAPRDLRNLLWSSIDNVESRDLDQIEYVERLDGGKTRIMVGIADVDAFVPKDSAIDKHAFQNTTSVYTGVATFPMLPDALSFDLTSLLPDVDRLTMVIDLTVDSTGVVVSSEVYAAVTRNHAKLDYISIGNWLEQKTPVPDKVAAVDGLTEQLLLQNEIKEKIKTLRLNQGSLQLQTPEAATVAVNGIIMGLEIVEDNPARELIENFMIAANIAVSHFLTDKKFPSLRRIVREPQRWDELVKLAKSFGFALSSSQDAKSLAAFLIERKQADPVRFPDLSLTVVKLLGRGEYVVEIPGQPDIGHFALAVHDYTHATAPNRRFTDLVTQRLLKAAIAGKPSPYSLDELEAVAKQCTEMESASNKVERTMRKISAAVLLSKHIGDTYDAIVTGVKGAEVFVRLFRPPAEGMVVQNGAGCHVGDKIKVKLLATEVEKAFVDFAKV
jgi:VacB/RNase II family 3'-5' exoribonuclease